MFPAVKSILQEGSFTLVLYFDGVIISLPSLNVTGINGDSGFFVLNGGIHFLFEIIRQAG